MQTRLLEDPVWLEPNETLLKLAGQSVLVIAEDGTKHEGIVVVSLSREGPLRYSIRIINSFRRYLTADAVSMIRPRGDNKETELVLSFKA